MVILPSQEHRRTSHLHPRKPCTGLDALTHALIGVWRRRPTIVPGLLCEANEIDALEGRFQNLSDRRLGDRLRELRRHFRRHPDAEGLPIQEAMAALREAATRQIGLRPFVVQLVGALALYRGLLAEMATGEGKTLTAGLAATLAAWSGRPCHIITANDYLVERDAVWLRPLYRFAGLTPGWITGTMAPAERREGYARDITYTTSKEIVADFLRDRLILGKFAEGSRRLIQSCLHRRWLDWPGMVQRGLHTAIVDEADCLLIDEAVTPLIISTQRSNESLRDAVLSARELAAPLKRGEDYRVDPRHREIELKENSRLAVFSNPRALPPLFQNVGRREELVRQALTAREFYQRGHQYVIDGGKVAIVDEFTGRILPQRTWRAGLHQAIEAKEDLVVTSPTETIARLSFQRFFRLFHRLSGMTGTAREAAREFWQIYRLPMVRIPTNRPCIRRQQLDAIFADGDAKWGAVVREIRDVHATSRPILVGTRSITHSEQLADMLRECGLEFQLLNAIHHKEEAQIITMAGQPGSITIATNMAGRGTDIRLGDGIAAAGGLHVIATERHESGRIDRQFFGRSARQGDPGSARAFMSMDDELACRFLPASLRRQIQNGLRKNIPGFEKTASLAIHAAQKRAEYQAYRQRQSVLRMDTWLEDALSFSSSNARGVAEIIG